MAGFSISFEADIAQLASELPRWANERIPSITRNALNDTIVEGRFAEIDKIRGVFDRPTRFVANSPLYRKATRDNLVAEVYIRNEASGGRAPSRVLDAEVHGGPRRAKAFELKLRRAGIMRADEFALPAIGQQRDQYGNLPRGLINRILAQLQAAGGVGFMANETKRSRTRNRASRAVRYFVPAGMRQERGIGRLPRGVFERRGKKIRAVLIFVSQPVYRKRYDMGQATIAKAERVFAPYWQRYFYRELAKHTGR